MLACRAVQGAVLGPKVLLLLTRVVRYATQQLRTAPAKERVHKLALPLRCLARASR